MKFIDCSTDRVIRFGRLKVEVYANVFFYKIENRILVKRNREFQHIYWHSLENARLRIHLTIDELHWKYLKSRQFLFIFLWPVYCIEMIRKLTFSIVFDFIFLLFGFCCMAFSHRVNSVWCVFVWIRGSKMNSTDQTEMICIFQPLFRCHFNRIQKKNIKKKKNQNENLFIIYSTHVNSHIKLPIIKKSNIGIIEFRSNVVSFIVG